MKTFLSKFNKKDDPKSKNHLEGDIQDFNKQFYNTESKTSLSRQHTKETPSTNKYYH